MRQIAVATAAVVFALSGALPAGAAVPTVPTDSFSFWPAADTFVDSSRPTSTFGAYTSMTIDASPRTAAYLRFDVSGISGRAVRTVRLRMFSTDGSVSGGRVFALTSVGWTEAMTWNDRPAIDGAQLGAFGAVTKGSWHEVDLGPFIRADCAVSIALTSSSSDGAGWETREERRAPRLIVDAEPEPGLAVHGLTRVSAVNTASSDPTAFPSTHRLAMTAGGRTLAIHGVHRTGVQLTWRNAGGTWQVDSTGASTDGLLLRDSGTGDWSASIVVAPDANGVEHAWVVWSAQKFTTTARPVQLVRLGNLDAPGGPTVSAPVTIDLPALGAIRPDLSFELDAQGARRGVISWYRRVGDTAYELVTTWFSDLGSSAPAFHDRAVVFTSTSANQVATLEPAGAAGTRLVARSGSRTRIYRHDAGAPLTTWIAGASGIYTSSSAVPSAVVLDTGETLAAVESDTANRVVTVQRFSANGLTATVDLQAAGYTKPSIASDGQAVTLLMIRASDGYVVSRTFRPGMGWSGDRVEIGAAGGGKLVYPTTLRRGGVLSFIVEGRDGRSTSQTEVLAFSRPF